MTMSCIYFLDFDNLQVLDWCQGMGRGEEHKGKVGLFYFVSHVLAPAGKLCNRTSGLK